MVANGRSIACFDANSAATVWEHTLWKGAETTNGNLRHAVTIVNGRVVSPFIRAVSRQELYRGIPIKEEIPNRRLVALDLETGRRLWDHRTSEEVLLRKASVAVAPIASGGYLFFGAVLREAVLKSYLVCVEASTGRLVWPTAV